MCLPLGRKVNGCRMEERGNYSPYNLLHLLDRTHEKYMLESHLRSTGKCYWVGSNNVYF